MFTTAEQTNLSFFLTSKNTHTQPHPTDQGFSLKKRRFFKHIHYILTLGVLGTILHFAVLVAAFFGLNRLWLFLRLPVNSNLAAEGLLRDEVLLLCSVLSSADEVAALALIKQEEYPKLSAVLFGEGVLNDAVSLRPIVPELKWWKGGKGAWRLAFSATADDGSPHSIRSPHDAIHIHAHPTQVSILLFRTILTGAVTGRTGVWAGLGLLGKALQLLVCSTLIGLAVSLAISRFLKVNTGICQHPTRQTIIIMLGSYVRCVPCRRGARSVRRGSEMQCRLGRWRDDSINNHATTPHHTRGQQLRHVGDV